MLVEQLSSFGFSEFNPDLMFKNLVNSFSNAEKIYGDSLISLATGFDSEYVKKNIRIPEFKDLVKKRLKDKFSSLKKKKLVDNNGFFTFDAYKLASKILLSEEYEKFFKNYFNNDFGKVNSLHGIKELEKPYSNQKYRDINIKKSIKKALRRNHDEIFKEDLVAFERQSKPKVEVVFSLDVSGSMKGEKFLKARRAFAALVVRALELGDKVGLLLFNEDVVFSFPIGSDVFSMLNSLFKIVPYGKTDLYKGIFKSLKLFSDENVKKHLLVITDLQPTKGEDPYKDAVKASFIAKESNVSVSVVGVNVDKKSSKFALKIAEASNGKFYSVSEDSIGKIIIEDYESFSKE